MKVSKTPLSLIQGLMSGDDKVSITRDISSPEGLGGSFLLLPKSLENAIFSQSLKASSHLFQTAMEVP
jgi:hypothetical protein